MTDNRHLITRRQAVGSRGRAALWPAERPLAYGPGLSRPHVPVRPRIGS